MSTRLHRAITEAIRDRMNSMSWDERWCGPDRGLILCWEIGRQIRDQDRELAQRAEAGELVTLPWKGGAGDVEPGGKKEGVTQYLAMWQGLRGEDLDIDLEADNTRVCSRRNVRVVFRPHPPAEPS
jgi:hypothetical protein